MEYKFSELFTWTSGKPITPTQGSVPIYGSNGIIGYTDVVKYNNRIILGRVGAYCGSVAYCSSDFNATDNTLITTCDEKKIIYYYAFYLLKLFDLNKFAGGAAQPLITQSILKKLKCSIPPLHIQQKTASILSTYDTLIENNTKRIRLLEQMAENLYKEWFVRFRFPGHEKVEMENGLPKGWKVGKINEIAEINPLRILKKGETATYLDMGNMPTSGSFPIDWECKQYNGGAKFQNGDVLIARITPCLENGKIAYVYFLKDNEVAFGSTEYIVLAPKSNMISPFLYCMCRTNHFISYASNGMVGASGRQRVSGEVIGKYELIIPPMQILKDIKPLLDSFFYQIKLLSIQNQLLTRQRDLLLPRLMSGKLEVKV